MTEHNITKEFESHRPALVGLAYRMTGSHAEAEDLVQDVYIAWQKADHNLIKAPRRWLMTVCSRRAIDLLRSARISKTNYIGPWLPEPIQLAASDIDTPSIEDDMQMAESATTAFLLVLERLSPKERAAFLLHDIFDLDYQDIAKTLSITEIACRKLVSRARANIKESDRAKAVSPDREQALVDAFLEALKSGDTKCLARLLAEDVTLQADSGGKAIAIREPLLGQNSVIHFIANILGPAWRDATIEVENINATLGLIVRENGITTAVVSFGADDNDLTSQIFIMRNPDKLSRI